MACWPWKNSVTSGQVVATVMNDIDPTSEEAVVGNMRYIAPSAPVPIHKWDYTNPIRVRKAFDAGRRDGEALRGVIGQFLESRDDRREPA